MNDTPYRFSEGTTRAYIHLDDCLHVTLPNVKAPAMATDILGVVFEGKLYICAYSFYSWLGCFLAFCGGQSYITKLLRGKYHKSRRMVRLNAKQTGDGGFAVAGRVTANIFLPKEEIMEAWSLMELRHMVDSRVYTFIDLFEQQADARYTEEVSYDIEEISVMPVLPTRRQYHRKPETEIRGAYEKHPENEGKGSIPVGNRCEETPDIPLGDIEAAENMLLRSNEPIIPLGDNNAGKDKPCIRITVPQGVCVCIDYAP